MELLTETRMKNAAQLLYDTRLKIGAISKKVGYADARYFSKVFRKRFQMTPVEYRRASTQCHLKVYR
jgi:two-component system response regulator YesN